jgi:hypothetical protein
VVSGITVTAQRRQERPHALAVALIFGVVNAVLAAYQDFGCLFCIITQASSH